MPGKRGRPKGHRLSAETKQQISKSKMGYVHSEKTKCKISKSLIKYFDRQRKEVAIMAIVFTGSSVSRTVDSLITSISTRLGRLRTASPSSKQYNRIRAGQELVQLYPAIRSDGYAVQRVSNLHIFVALGNQFILHTKNCRCDEISNLQRQIIQNVTEARVAFLEELKTSELKDRIVEHLQAQSRSYSRKHKLVISRDGNGSSHQHYTIHSPLLPLDINDKQALREYFPDYHEFLMDEDGRFMINNLRDVTVREVRLGKITYKEDLEPEPSHFKVTLRDIAENTEIEGLLQGIDMECGKTRLMLKLESNVVSPYDLRFYSFMTIENFDGEYAHHTHFTPAPADQDVGLDMCVAHVNQPH